MNFKSILIYVALAVSHSSVVCGRKIGADEEVNSVSDVFNEKKFRSIAIDENNAAITCGGVLTDTSKQIIYKPFTQVGDNERCVWIVAPANASSYRIRVEADFEGRQEYLLNVGTIRSDNYLVNNGRLTSTWRTLPANTVVITFHSPSNPNSKGFLLEYEVLNSYATISPQSKNSIIEADSVAFKYPSTTESYTNYELSTFVIVPPNNVRSEGNSHLLMYWKLGLESASCNDLISIYNFNVTANEYIWKKNLCGYTDVDLLNIGDDTSLLVFKSDNSATGQGFIVGTAPANCGN